MNDRDKYINHLIKEVNDLEDKVNNIENINKKNQTIKKRLKMGITITFLLPAIVSSFLAYYGFKKINKTPFKIDKETSYAKIITTKTSTQKEEEKITYVKNNTLSSTIEYSTKWKLNENNLYERQVFLYRFNDRLENIEFNEILKMTYEEMNKFFILEDKQKIQKLYLDEEDQFYNEDMVILTHEKIDKDNKKLSNESSITNFFTSIEYICLLIILFTINAESLKKLKVYKKILERNEEKYKQIEITNYEEIKQIIKIRKENMELFDEPKKNVYDKR